MPHRQIIALGWLMVNLVACAAGEPEGMADAGVQAAAKTDPPWTDQCVAPAGTTASPHTIADVVSLLNAMPKPVSLPCFLATLARPLELHATRSLISAQPAVGRRSPRIFVFLDGVMLSVVPDGVGSRLLEFGEARPGARSLKAEIEFPIADTLSPAAPFERLMYDDTVTSCGFCHAAEAAAEDITFTRAFVSQALRPAPNEQVRVDALRGELAACDASAEPERCAMLQGIFARGDPLDRDFPADFVLFR